MEGVLQADVNVMLWRLLVEWMHRLWAVAGGAAAWHSRSDYAMPLISPIPEIKSFALSQNPEHQQSIREPLKAAFAQKTLKEWEEVFAGLDACVEPELTISEAAEDPQMQARNMVIEVAKEGGGHQKQIGHPIKFSATPCEIGYTGRTLGADNDNIQY